MPIIIACVVIIIAFSIGFFLLGRGRTGSAAVVIGIATALFALAAIALLQLFENT